MDEMQVQQHMFDTKMARSALEASDMKAAYDKLNTGQVQPQGSRGPVDPNLAAVDAPISTPPSGPLPTWPSSGLLRAPSVSSGSMISNHASVAEKHDCVTIFFSDLCGFSTWAHELPPEAVMATLDDLYTRLDNIILEEMPGLYKVGLSGLCFIGEVWGSEQPVQGATCIPYVRDYFRWVKRYVLHYITHGFFSNLLIYSSPCCRAAHTKVETIGDAYMVAANLVEPDPQHAATLVRFALRAQEEAAKVPRPDVDDGSTLSLRIGKEGGAERAGARCSGGGREGGREGGGEVDSETRRAS